MSTRVYLGREALERVIEHLSLSSDVIAPTRPDGADRPDFTLVTSVGDIFLGPAKTRLPLKALFTPPCEEMFRFSTVDGTLSISPTTPIERDRVVLGALGCDVASLEILDKVMLKEPVDQSYKARRDRTTIVALSCEGEDSTCFCASLGIDPVRPVGADAHMTPVKGGWVLAARTNAGESLLEEIGSFTSAPTTKQTAQADAFTSSSRGELSIQPLNQDWDGLWDLQVWEDSASRCIECGICTIMCPTCHCFDVHDDARGSEGARVRSWDSCMSKNFTMMAHGENPRPEHPARVRQRYMHKLVYFPQNHNVVACVGCGRCTMSCPNRTGLDEIARRIAEEGGSDD